MSKNDLNLEIRKWLTKFLEILESVGIEKKEIAKSLSITAKTVSNWIKDDESPTPRKNSFIRLAIACIRLHGLDLGKESIGGSVFASVLLGSSAGLFVGGKFGMKLAEIITTLLNENMNESSTKKKRLVEDLSALDLDQAGWGEIISLLNKNKEFF